MLPGIDNLLHGLWQSVGIFFASTWWFIAFMILLPVAHSTLLFWRQRHYEHSLRWVFLEMKIPREVLKSPRSMDQTFQAIHALRNIQGNLYEKYIDGEVVRWTSYEIVSFGGEVHFYVRCTQKARPMIEAAFFAYYPDLELTDAPDYTKTYLPPTYADMRASGVEMWGGELKLDKEGMYPIRSYREFESPDEIHQVDPVASMVEGMSKVKKEEFLCIQINIQPMRAHWRDEFEEEFADLKKPTRIKAEEIEGDDSGYPATVQRTPGQTRVLELIDNNLSKPAFETIIRFIYTAPDNIFYDTFPRRMVTGAFNQYADTSLNFFWRNEMMTSKMKVANFPYIFTNTRKKIRSQRMINYFKHREMHIETFMGKVLMSHPFHWGNKSRPFILNTESLATIFHPPTSLVMTAPHMARVESRKMAAPAGLQIYGDETALDKFK